MKKLIYLYLSLVLVFVSTSCQKSFNKYNDDCPDNIACTQVFISLTINLELQNINIEQVSHSETKFKSNGEKIFEYNYQPPFDSGPYYGYILDDSVLKKIRKSGDVVLYTLYNTEGEVIISEEFTVGHDCCHVLKIKGNDKIII